MGTTDATDATGAADGAMTPERGVKAHHVVAFGLPLTAVALYERLRGGRDYVFCHASPAVNHITMTALCLILAAGVVSVVGAWVVRHVSRRSATALVFIAVVGALIVAADGVDAHGEREAARIAARGLDERICDYTPQVYDATPGWFFW
jgi:hypothetical protein